MKRYHLYKKEKTTGISFCNCIFAGICISVVFFVVFDKRFPSFETGYKKILVKDGPITRYGYLYFLLKQRIRDLFIVLGGTALWGYKKVSKCGAMLQGFVNGLLLCFCVRNFFLKGIILWGVYQFPHGIFYVLALFLWGKLEQKYVTSIMDIGYNKRAYIKIVLQNIIILLVVMFGFLSEFYVNMEIMEKVLKIFKYE